MIDGFGGLAAGIAASVFIVMTIVVLPICSGIVLLHLCDPDIPIPFKIVYLLLCHH